MITGGFREGLLKVWDKESNALISEYQTGHTSIGHVVGGGGKVVASTRVGYGLYQIMFWDGDMIDAEGL